MTVSWHRDSIKVGVVQFITKAELKPYNNILQPDYKNSCGEGKNTGTLINTSLIWFNGTVARFNFCFHKFAFFSFGQVIEVQQPLTWRTNFCVCSGLQSWIKQEKIEWEQHPLASWSSQTRLQTIVGHPLMAFLDGLTLFSESSALSPLKCSECRLTFIWKASNYYGKGLYSLSYCKS